jgi:cytochrome c-type biogenesis protein CcmH/NrfG
MPLRIAGWRWMRFGIIIPSWRCASSPWPRRAIPTTGSPTTTTRILQQETQSPANLRDVEREARAVIRLNPEFAEGYAILGSALAPQAHNAEAVAAYEQALRLQPASELYAVNLAMLLCAANRCADAKPIFAGLLTSKDARISTTAQGYLQGMSK